MNDCRWSIIWPQYRTLTEAQIRMMYSDAVANGEAEETELRDPDEMARELHSIGTITLGRKL